MIKVDLFGTETEWKPIKKYGVTLPGYFVNREGEILSETRVAYRYYSGTLKDGKDYKPPTAQQADEIRRILKKNKGKLKGKGGIPLAQRKTNDVNTYG